MYSYDEFKEKMIRELPGALGDLFPNYKVRNMPVTKRGKVKDGFCLFSEDSKDDTQIMPTLYFDDIYKMYSESGDYEMELFRAAQSMKLGLRESTKFRGNVDVSKMRERIVFQLINTSGNESILNDVPNRRFLDLSIIYRWAVYVDEHGISSTLITDELAEHIGITEEELFRIACENTERIMPARILDMDDMIASILNRDSDIDLEELRSVLGEHMKMHLITNICGTIGASVLLYDKVLSDLADKLRSDIYILPSSVNEVIAVSASNADPGQLLEMVRHVNATEVPQEYFLSDNIYYYSRKACRLYTVASDMVV